MATKEEIRSRVLASEDRVTKVINVPAWGGDITIRELSMADRAAAYNAMDSGEDDKRPMADRASAFSAELVVRSVVDEDGNRVFGAADIAALAGKANRTLDHVVAAIRALNGLGQSDKETAAGEDLEKN